MKIKISSKVTEKYPELEVGVVVVKNLDNKKDSPEIQQLFRQAEKEIRKKVDSERISEMPVIAKWRQAYKSFGAKPRYFRSSVESLVRRVLKKELPAINPIVDIYNYISIKYLMTVGGEDVDKIEGDLILDFSNGQEEFVAIGSIENEPPMEGEIVYKDDKGVICRCWNWREGDRTKLTEETKDAVVVIENLDSDESQKLNEALEETKVLLEKYCGASCEIAILNKDNLEKEIN